MQSTASSNRSRKPRRSRPPTRGRPRRSPRSSLHDPVVVLAPAVRSKSMSLPAGPRLRPRSAHASPHPHDDRPRRYSEASSNAGRTGSRPETIAEAVARTPGGATGATSASRRGSITSSCTSVAVWISWNAAAREVAGWAWCRWRRGLCGGRPSGRGRTRACLPRCRRTWRRRCERGNVAPRTSRIRPVDVGEVLDEEREGSSVSFPVRSSPSVWLTENVEGGSSDGSLVGDAGDTSRCPPLQPGAAATHPHHRIETRPAPIYRMPRAREGQSRSTSPVAELLVNRNPGGRGS